MPYFLIFKPYFNKTTGGKHLSPKLVFHFLCRSIMDLAVNFNDQSSLIAVKIRNKTVDYLLSPEPDPQHLFSPQSFPKQLL